MPLHQKYRVLLVDDYVPVRITLRSMLRSYVDLQIVGEACDGIQAIEQVAACQPDVILMDVMMPKMNGMEALEKIKADAALKDIPVIMLSNLAGDGDMSTAMSKGALKYIIKSEHDPKEIVSIVDETIGEK